MGQVEGLVDKETWYPPHSEELLEEHFFKPRVSSLDLCNSRVYEPQILG